MHGLLRQQWHQAQISRRSLHTFRGVGDLQRGFVPALSVATSNSTPFTSTFISISTSTITSTSTSITSSSSYNTSTFIPISSISQGIGG